MGKSKTAVLRAKITYFFKETFRFHSKAEYKEIFSRGLNEDNSGVSGAFPWLYVRAFFALFILFTANVLVLRLTNNTLYVPSVNFLGGITFTVPFIILLYELYPKRDISLFMILVLLVCGGTVSTMLTQIGYAVFEVKNRIVLAVVAGLIEEISKGLVAIVAILLLKNKNPYTCFLVAATVGAGFSVIEDMGYIFYYADRYVFYYHSDIQATVAMFVDRGLSSFCTHILWTGAIGWAFSSGTQRHSLPRLFVVSFTSIVMHICWDLPLEGWWQVLDIAVCVVVAAAINISIVHTARLKTLASEMDLTAVNEAIILQAKSMGVRTRYVNASHLTFSLCCSILAVLVLLFCAMPIGMDYSTVNYDTKEDFIAFIEDGLDLKANWNRAYDPSCHNVEMLYIEGELKHVVQNVEEDGYDYFYSYYLTEENGEYSGELESISVELEKDGSYVRVYCSEYVFGNATVTAFDVNADVLIDYIYNADGSVTAVTDAEEFTGYFELTAICIAGGVVVVGCAVAMIVLAIKIRRLKNVE